jgi:hypothetical protein
MFPPLWRNVGSESRKDGDESDWIDRDKDRNESEEKFLDHCGARFLTCAHSKRNT